MCYTDIALGDLMVNNAVGWFEIYVEDMQRAKKFYEGVFGVSLENLNMPDMEMWSFPMDDNGPGASGALVKMEGFTPTAGGTIVYFSSEDCSVEESKVEQMGGKVKDSKFSIGQHGFVSMAVDTEGNVFGIHSPK